MRADRFDGRAEEGIEDKNGAEEGIEKSLNFSCPNFKKKNFSDPKRDCDFFQGHTRNLP